MKPKTQVVTRVVIVVLVLIAGVLVFAATKPGILRVQRVVTINAPPDKVFALINDLHNWSKWEEQDREDSSTVKTFSGAAEGVGAACELDGKGRAGKARMLITESIPGRKIKVQVDFERPFRAHNINQFDLEAVGGSTRITWDWQGTNVYVLKLMSIFANVDRVMGKHFESGLGNLKAAAEAQ